MLCFYFWLCRVFCGCGRQGLLSSWGAQALDAPAPSCRRWTRQLQLPGSVAVAHGLSFSAACGIFADQELKGCLLHWQVDSPPLCYLGSPLMGYYLAITLVSTNTHFLLVTQTICMLLCFQQLLSRIKMFLSPNFISKELTILFLLPLYIILRLQKKTYLRNCVIMSFPSFEQWCSKKVCILSYIFQLCLQLTEFNVSTTSKMCYKAKQLAQYQKQQVFYLSYLQSLNYLKC